MVFFNAFFNYGGNKISSSQQQSSTPSSQMTTKSKPHGGWLDAVEDSPMAGQTIEVYDLNGNGLKLGAKDEKGSGGEGTVYELPMNNKLLVKIYKDEILKDTRKMTEIRRRITDMINLGNCVKMPFLAWPVMPVFNARKEIIGFVMRKCSGNSFLTLRGPRFIKQRFRGWTRRQLALTALDYVKKVRLLVANKVLVNDFNPANFLVNDKCEVSFIDCDSFQIPSAKGGVNITRTFFPSHVAPELLLEKQRLAVPRNVHHVEFGAALTVFNILMCGLHPYNYCDPAHKSACGTPDENLKKGRCPLGKGAGCMLPQGGWYNLWSWLSYRLKNTFIRMFQDGHANPAARPSLEELQANIENYLHDMQFEPERANLEPSRAKSKEWKKAPGGIWPSPRPQYA